MGPFKVLKALHKTFEEGNLFPVFLFIAIDTMMSGIVFGNRALGKCSEGGQGVLGFSLWNSCNWKTTDLADSYLWFCSLFRDKGNSHRGLVHYEYSDKGT